jgi:hypothetical protein
MFRLLYARGKKTTTAVFAIGAEEGRSLSDQTFWRRGDFLAIYRYQNKIPGFSIPNTVYSVMSALAL